MCVKFLQIGQHANILVAENSFLVIASPDKIKLVAWQHLNRELSFGLKGLIDFYSENFYRHRNTV
jgi:hypothetical protein